MQIEWGTVETLSDFILGGSKIPADGDCSHEIKRRLLLGRKVMTNLDSMLKSRDITLPTKVHLVKAMVFQSSHVWMWELDYKERWAPKIGVFELWCWRRLLRVPWTVRWSNQSLNQSWIFVGRTNAEAETPMPPDANNWFIGKDLDAGKDWRWEEKGTTEDEMVGWHHWLNGHEFE